MSTRKGNHSHNTRNACTSYLSEIYIQICKMKRECDTHKTPRQSTTETRILRFVSIRSFQTNGWGRQRMIKSSTILITPIAIQNFPSSPSMNSTIGSQDLDWAMIGLRLFLKIKVSSEPIQYMATRPKTTQTATLKVLFTLNIRRKKSKIDSFDVDIADK